jgi:hypothetical protein
MQIKRPYIICLKIDAFLYNIRAICLYFSVNIKLNKLVAKKRSLFLALANLYKFLKNCFPSVKPSIKTLFGIKLVFISIKTASKQGL